MEIKTSLNLSKTNAENAANQLAELATSSPLETMAKIKYLETTLDHLKKLIKDSLVQEIMKYPKNKAGFQECELSVVNGWDEPEYEADETYKQLAEQLAARKELLKMAHKIRKEIVCEDGEVIPVLPVGKSVADRIVVKLKK